MILLPVLIHNDPVVLFGMIIPLNCRQRDRNRTICYTWLIHVIHDIYVIHVIHAITYTYTHIYMLYRLYMFYMCYIYIYVICIYIYMCICVYVYVYVHTYTGHPSGHLTQPWTNKISQIIYLLNIAIFRGKELDYQRLYVRHIPMLSLDIPIFHHIQPHFLMVTLW